MQLELYQLKQPSQLNLSVHLITVFTLCQSLLTLGVLKNHRSPELYVEIIRIITWQNTWLDLT